MTPAVLPLTPDAPLSPLLASQVPDSHPDASAWREACHEIGIPSDGRGLRVPAMQDMLLHWVSAIERTRPRDLDGDHVTRLVQTLRSGLVAAFSPPADVTHEPSMDSLAAHGLLTENPFYGALLRHRHREHRWDTELTVLAHLWWRSRTHVRRIGPGHRYRVAKAWRYAGNEGATLSPQVHQRLTRLEELSAYEIGAILREIVDLGQVNLGLSEHLELLAYYLTALPRRGKGSSGGHRGPAQYKEMQHLSKRQAAVTGEPGALAALELGGSESEDPETLLRGGEPLYRPSPTPAQQRRQARGLKDALARQNQRLPGTYTLSMTLTLVDQLRQRAEQDSETAAVYYLGLALGEPWRTPTQEKRLSGALAPLIRALPPGADIASQGLGPDEICYCQTHGDLYIGRAHPASSTRTSEAERPDGTPWTLQLSGQPALRIARTLASVGADGQRLDALLSSVSHIVRTLTAPIVLDDGTTVPRRVVSSIGTALHQYAQHTRMAHSVELDALFARTLFRQHADSPAYYIRMDSGSLSARYQAIWEAFSAALGWYRPALPLQSFSAPPVSIGSARAPEREELCSVIMTLQDTIREEARLIRGRTAQGDYGPSRHRLVIAATTYVWLQTGLACAARGVRSPGPAESGYAEHDLFALLQDKDAHGPDEARVSGMPESVRASKHALRGLLRERANELGLASPEPDLAEQFLTISHEGSCWTIVSPEWLREAVTAVGAEWAPNALRHFTATWAVAQGVPEVIQRHWLGHWREGQAPVGGASLLSMTEVATAIEHYSTRLLTDVGATLTLTELLEGKE